MDLTKVKEIKQLLEKNELTQQEIGEMYGISRSYVGDIATGRAYKEVEPILLPRRIAVGVTKNQNFESQNVALKGQIANLRDERNILNRQLKAASKRIAVVDEIVKQLYPIIQPIPPLKRFTPKIKGSNIIDETLVLMLSDPHFDQIVTPEEVDGLEDYNFLVGARRAEVLIEEMLKFTMESLSNFRFKKLIIMGLGDYTCGELRNADKRSFYRDQFTNDLAISHLLSQMFAEVASYFMEVEVISIVGNHGRLTDKIEFHKESIMANHDTLIMKIAEIHCRDIKNLKFEFPNGLSTIKEIEGWNFFLNHGHGKKGSSETWQRAKKKSQTTMPLHRGKIHYFCSGHFHTSGDVAVSGGVKLIGNGAFLACDQFSYQSLDEASEPSQYIFGVHKHNGVTWRLPIRLRTEGEKEGPKRYSIMESM